MTDTKVRKAVVTTAQVNDALSAYVKLYSEVSGQESPALELDRGPRGGQPFAVYVKGSDTIVKGFDTKDSALAFYSNYVDVAQEILGALVARDLISESDLRKESNEADKPAEKAAAAPRKVAAKVVQGSAEGDAKKA
jgi:hypothetical protein